MTASSTHPPSFTPRRKAATAPNISAAEGITKVKCVMFDLQPTIHDIPPRSELSADEIDNTWYSRLELEIMVAAALDPADERNQEHHASGGSRGLERYRAAQSSRLEIHRVQVVAAVLREQSRQRRKYLLGQIGSHGEERIAKASQKLSRECQDLAYRQGYNDEVEAYAGTQAIHTDVVTLNKPTLLKQMQAIKSKVFLGRTTWKNKNVNR